MILVMEKACALGGGTMESWWELNSYERETPIGILVNPTRIAKKKIKSELKNIVEKMGLQIVEVLNKNRFKLGFSGGNK